jgi:proteasome lid subunit RPN8/RPN11
MELPNECCGLLIGPAGASHDAPLVEASARCRNVLASPARYQIDPAEHFAVVRRLRGTARGVVGAYHSHPRSDPTPSASDLAEAHYPEFVWVIVSLAGPGTPRVRAFRLGRGNFLELALVPVP